MLEVILTLLVMPMLVLVVVVLVVLAKTLTSQVIQQVLEVRDLHFQHLLIL